MSLFDALDAFPSPWNWRFLTGAVAASVIATMAAGYRADPSGIAGGIVVLVLSVAAVILGRRLFRPDSGLFSGSPALRVIAVPLLLGLPPLLTGFAMGSPGAGGYPAALIILLAVALMITRNIERHARVVGQGRVDFPVHTAYHGTLAWISTLFFFFGVISLWPWLGHIYGGGYFWILVLGVLFPTLYLWGRLRQPRQHHSMVALARFNRMLPYIGVLLLIAILVG